jgi:hypothetical protein
LGQSGDGFGGDGLRLGIGMIAGYPESDDAGSVEIAGQIDFRDRQGTFS